MAEYSGYKTIISKEIAATPGTYAAFAQVMDLSGPAGTADTIETSHRDSTFKKFQAGMRDGGEVSFSIRFDPDLASHDPTLATSVYKDWELGRAVNYKITFPGAMVTTTAGSTTCVFNAVTTKFSFTSPLTDALDAEITLKINGALTWAHVAGT
jgi:hypothetical protein